MIGHECGHIHNNHVVYLTAMHYLSNVAGMVLRNLAVPALLSLRAWSRRAEVTCDRAGALCAGQLEPALRALTKLALGSQKLYEELNIEAFLEQHSEAKHSLGRFGEVFSSHPWLPKRVLALQAFAESELFRRHAGLGPGGLDMAQVGRARARLHQGDRLMSEVALTPPSELPLPLPLQALKAQVADDLASFRRGRGLALAGSARIGERVRHSAAPRPVPGANLPRLGRTRKPRSAPGLIEMARAEARAANLGSSADAELSTGPGSRLIRPSFEVSTFAVDASVVAALALGVGTLFANAAVGGLFLLAAPTLATFGRERGDRALRKRAAESAMKAVDEAVARLGTELERVIDAAAR